MAGRSQMTFIPGGLVPAGGVLALWIDADADAGALSDAAAALGLPPGESISLSTIGVSDEGVKPIVIPALAIPLLPAVRRLAALLPGSDHPGWSRPSASILAWSVAAKLGLELVSAGRLLPVLRPASDPSQAIASWRVATAGDTRITDLARVMPTAAHALRRSNGVVWSAQELLAAFLDSVADCCAREGRRPELNPRGRGPRRDFGSMWAEALTGSDPTVGHLRIAPGVLAADLSEWAAPLLGDQRTSDVRLNLRLTAPPVGDDGSSRLDARFASAERPWLLKYQIQSLSDPESRLDAQDVWEQAGGPVELAGGLIDDGDVVLVRNLARAARLYRPIDRSLSEPHPVGVELTLSEVADLLNEGVDALAAGGIGIELPPELRQIESRTLRLRVRIGQATPTAPRADGQPLLGRSSITSLHHELALGGDAISEEEFAEIVASKQPLVRWRGTWVRVEHEQIDRLAELAGQTTALDLTEALAAALSGQHEVEGIGWVETVADGAIGRLIDELLASDGPGDAVIEGIEGELRPYQCRGVAWLQRLSELGMGGVLADEMGLGKTLEAIALLTSRDQDRPHLVVCPTSVVGNWVRELNRFAPAMVVQRHHGPDRAVSRRAFRPGEVVVTSYALLRRDIGMLEDVAWDVVVFDEAQQIKNPSSKGARAARSLGARARIAMTGTPIENRLSELWAIIDLTNPGLLGTERRFNERFAVPIERWHESAAAERLKRLVAPFVLRRRKDDPEVAVDLPPKQEITVACSLTREQAALYQAQIESAFSPGSLGTTAFERRGRVLALLTALKQICNHPRQFLRDDGRLVARSGKLDRATEILGELVDAGDHALVFTQFREMGLLLAQHLEREIGLPEVPFLHGGVPLGARDAMVERFQEDPDAPPLLLVSLRAGGTGLNLTRATHVLHFDRWWNPAVEDQATDRAHRIGQTQAVTVHTLVTAGTIEDRIAELLDRKRSLADAIVGVGESWITELNDEELRELVELSTVDFTDDEDPDAFEQDAPRPVLTALPGGRS